MRLYDHMGGVGKRVKKNEGRTKSLTWSQLGIFRSQKRTYWGETIAW